MTRLQEQVFNKYLISVKSTLTLTEYSVYLLYICGYVVDKLYCLHNRSVNLPVYFISSHNKSHIFYGLLIILIYTFFNIPDS